MLKHLLLPVFVLATLNLCSQNTKHDIKVQEFKAAINRQFTKITTGTAFSNLGNFASVSSDAKSLAIAGNFITPKNSVWGLEISGGATEGIFKIFNNEVLNSNFAGELKYHRLLNSGSASRNYFDVLEVEEQVAELNNQFEKDSFALVKRKDIYKVQVDIIASEAKIAEANKQLAKVDSMLLIRGISRKIQDSLEAVKGNHEFEAENQKLTIENLKKQLARFKANDAEYFDVELERKAQARDKKLKELAEKKKAVELLDFDISWVSFGLKVKNNEVKLFTPANLPPAQYSDTSFVSQRLTASYSKYRSNTLQKGDVYWSAGFYIDYTSNFNSLKKLEIEERIPVPGNPQQEIKKTINAYQGAYEEGIVEFTLFCDYYKFFGQYNTIVGLHFNPVFSYSETVKKPLSSLLVGILVPFGDKDKQASKVNIEIFYDRRDIFNYLDKDVKTSSIGIRATLPVTFLNNKS